MSKKFNLQLVAEKLQEAEKLLILIQSKNMPELAEELAQVIQKAKDFKFTIAIVGEAKRGKSTLINGLLGRHDDLLAPIGKFPTTNIVTYYTNGPCFAKVFFNDSPEHFQEISYDEIKDYVCEDKNPDNQKGVARLEISGDFPLLGSEVRLADTPGANNALSDLHDEVLFRFLPLSDAVIFLVSGDSPITDSEQQLLKKINAEQNRKLLFVVNKADKCSDEELKQGNLHNRKILDACGFSQADIIPASARKYYREGADDGILAVINKVEEIIRESTSALQLKAVVEQQILSIFTKCQENIRQRLELYQMNHQELDARQKKLSEILERLRDDRELLEHNFQRDWDQALDDFQIKVNSAKIMLKKEFAEKVSKSSDLQLKPLTSTINSEMIIRRNELLSEPSDLLSQQLQHAAEKLQRDYCMISLQIPAEKLPEIMSSTKSLLNGGKVLLAGVPATLAAVAVCSVPQLVLSAVATAAPAIAWNPSTWLPAVSGAAATTLTSALVSVLTPITAIATPVLIGYSFIRIFQAWKAKNKESRNLLQNAVMEQIDTMFMELFNNISALRKQKNDIVDSFFVIQQEKIQKMREELKQLRNNAPDPMKIAELKKLQEQIENERK